MPSVRFATASGSSSATDLPSFRALVGAWDREALGEAYVRYRPLARKVIRERLHSARHRLMSDVDDLVQETFLQLPEVAHYSKEETSFGGCVVAAAIQSVGKWLRRNATGGRYATERSEIGAAFLRVSDPSDTPEEAAELIERIEQLEQLVMRMPTDLREILLAREIDGLSPEEIATRFDITRSVAIDRTSKARRKLEWLAARSPLGILFSGMSRRLKKGRAEERAAVLQLLADGQWHEGKEIRRLIPEFKQPIAALLRRDPVECERVPRSRYKFRFRLRCGTLPARL